jgi:DNA polymerase III epsilon subunit-like protein
MEVQRALIVDTETTALEDDPAARLIEVGVIVYSVINQTSLQELSTLVPNLMGSYENPAEYVNRIKPAALEEVNKFCAVEPLLNAIGEMINCTDVLVSHNAAFDRKFFNPSFFGGMKGRDHPVWLCTLEDFKWPVGHAQGSLAMLALDHGLGVATIHRALTDCRLIARLFDQVESPEVLQEMFRIAQRPKGLFVSQQKFEDNEIVKRAGFKYDRLIPKKWSRRMAIEDAASLPFAVTQVVE